ncbi:MAG: ATP-binding cassette domain-containing protein [Methanomassiliicoccales archaeon]
MSYAVRVQELTRTFNVDRKSEPVTALDHVDLEMEEGELFGLLGPNGAGKTTLIKILATLLLPSSGTAEVLGHDVTREAARVRPLINLVSGGDYSGYGLLTVRENIWMFSQFYGVPRKEARERIDHLIQEFGLEERADTKMRTLSTGERQKMNMIRGFVTDPRLIFLDEPTLGLDVNASHVIRDHVREWTSRERGRSVLLTTHYMMEADEMCDRVAIIDRGRILACDTPSNLKRRLNRITSYRIETTPFQGVEGIGQLEGVEDLTVGRGEEGFELTVRVEDESLISDIVSRIIGQGARIMSMGRSEPTLEDVFVQLVGRGLRSSTGP